MQEPRDLLDASIVREGAMLAHQNDTAADGTDDTNRRHLARVRTLLLDVNDRHRNLMVIVQMTADDYLLLQAEALKLRPPTRLTASATKDLWKDRSWRILLQKSKIDQPQKSRES
jgi:hypothetical protein